MGISCDCRHMHEFNFLRYLPFQEKIWNKNWWMEHRLDQSMPAVLRVWYRRRFSPTSSFHKTYKADKRRSCYLSNGRALFTHMEPGGHYFSSQQAQNVTLGYNFHGAPENILLQETEKWLCSNPGRVVTVYQICELFGNSWKRAATGEIMVNGFRATGLFPCDKNIFRSLDFPLPSDDTDASHVSHPALVKTSDQPSFCYANFSPFTFADALQASDVSPVPSLNWSQILVCSSKENKGYTLQKLCWDNSEY